MAGLFVMKGMEVHLTDFTISVDESGRTHSSISLAVALDVWPMWLDVAIEHAQTAQMARLELEAASGKGREGADPSLLADLMTQECRASLVAISAAAFALDNFHTHALLKLPGADELKRQWRNKTARHRRVNEVLRRLIRPTNPGSAELQSAVSGIFGLRDLAVHAPAAYRDPVTHDLLKQPVEWRLAQYTGRQANTAAYSATGVIWQACHNDHPCSPDLDRWCAARRERVQERLDRATRLEPRN
ncbi:hypothetical protein [Salsipaludibacter albus]|uniref:hypothetical protein n=1 Tax=Salsipaludibacter albus TaxID=2849650 RepID=UPI001EE49497|nr:hypothetical protein [Salsipaludibacter albus]MBY5163144.1 hypothetical protein [Salsipaludibacter albus]